MASTFKNFSGTTGVTNPIYTVPSSTVAIVLSITLANTASVATTVTLQVTRGGTTRSILYQATIPFASTLIVLEGSKFVLEAADELKCVSSETNAIDIYVSVMEQT